MQISELEIQGYRSIRELRIPLAPVTVLVGANGCGKSNIYQSLRLLAAASDGTLASSIAGEGGMASIIWAGERRKDEGKRVTLRVEFEDYEYSLEFGFIPISERPAADEASPFGLEIFRGDPDIKSEKIIYFGRKKPSTLLERTGASINARNLEGRMIAYPLAVSHCQSVLSELKEPHKFPELSDLRETFLGWRFYHKFRTDMHSPVRSPRIATLTPVLSHDGSDIASALATIFVTGDEQALSFAIEEAFTGASLQFDAREPELTFYMMTPGVNRPLDLKELSDGTLQYLCLLAALLSPRPAPLIVLNEPEASIHRDLIAPLADLIVRASKNSQIVVTTHNLDLAGRLARFSDSARVELEKIDGETRIR